VGEPTPIFDIVVAGAGASGLALAAEVKQVTAPKLGVVRFKRLDPAHQSGDNLFDFR
jgi:cation diffusion facilitator CzcD-associated flavoprotein CzcO